MPNSSSANIGFEEKLWAAADKMRGSMDPSEYKHVVLGLIFLKYISDSFEKLHEKLVKKEGKEEAEDKDYYTAENVFWVPQVARWNFLRDKAKNPEIGTLIDDAMIAIEKENPDLKGVLPKDYARPGLDKVRLGGVIDILSDVDLVEEKNKSKDVLGRIYEYFLGRFADQEGKGGGEFYTPQSVVKLLVEMIEPYKGRVFDPCCGSGGMFVQSEKFVKEHGGRIEDIHIFGQESNHTTWRLCKINLAVRGIGGEIMHGDSFHNDQHKDLKSDFILANPPFNDSDWGGENLRNDVRWQYGVPPVGNANYAWIEHFIHHLSPSGIAGFVMANGALASNTSGEGEIRKNLITEGLVDCIIAMPDKLFYNVGIPCTLWFVSRDRHDHKYRNRHDEILFIDARKMGRMIDRRHRELTDEEVKLISGTYHNWRNKNGKYEDKKGFSKAAKIDEVEKNGFVLTPGRYVGSEIIEEDDEVFEEKMKRLTTELSQQFQQSKELEEKIKENLNKVGF
ncbi:MAG: N-6 DNA methylase [Candidatus Berkelbacteria bacterium Licking1014_7]|uniref:site-specific DNA-methyltransferase (adenine-specific) n=1 Tax=Candidatus Berkelbacteria bacterium Licking1014_7 TaxID=2017147 RepID=A0A554LIK8_9BACT|nr:MAG: N-6 DNA methylase [Candidatus Berkelbacteria bacterium Licking1014_7]